jgi:hypothetical protein
VALPFLAAAFRSTLNADANPRRACADWYGLRKFDDGYGFFVATCDVSLATLSVHRAWRARHRLYGNSITVSRAFRELERP